jgi:hypothetical protein
MLGIQQASLCRGLSSSAGDVWVAVYRNPRGDLTRADSPTGYWVEDVLDDPVQRNKSKTTVATALAR